MKNSKKVITGCHLSYTDKFKIVRLRIAEERFQDV